MIQSFLYGNIQQFIREHYCISDTVRKYKENNWLGGGYVNGKPGWERATRRWHTYDFPMWFIRPHYKKETVIDKVKPKPVAKPSAKKPAKGKKIVLVAGHGLVLQLM